MVGIIRVDAPRRVHGARNHHRADDLTIGIIAVLVAAALALLLARSLTRPIGRLTKAVEAIGRGKPADISIDAGGETGMLARAFAHMVEETKAKTSALEHEVEERRRTEAARDQLAVRERLFSAAVESSDDSIVMQSLDGTIIGWNTAAERLYGYRPRKPSGNRHRSSSHPTVAMKRNDYLRADRTGRADRPFRNRPHPQGRHSGRDLGQPVADPGPVGRDHRRVRRGTRPDRCDGGPSARSSSRSRSAGNSSTPREDLIMIMNSRGDIVQISPSCETVLGYKPDEMIGRSGVDFIHPAHLDQSREEMRALRRGGHPKLADTRCIHKDGHEVWLSWLGSWSEQANVLLRRARHDRGAAAPNRYARASSSRATSSRPRSTPSSRPTIAAPS